MTGTSPSDIQAERKYTAVVRSAGKEENWTSSRTTSQTSRI